MSTVWRDYKQDDVYVARCSHCGKFRKDLKIHWFFTGTYCIGCIQDVLWDNCRIMEEMK